VCSSDLPRIAIVPQKIALAPEDYEGIAIGRDADDILSSVTGRARNMLVLMRPDRYVAVAMRIERAQTPESFVEVAKRLLAAI
jgi:hypothetical protein